MMMMLIGRLCKNRVMSRAGTRVIQRGQLGVDEYACDEDEYDMMMMMKKMAMTMLMMPIGKWCKNRRGDGQGGDWSDLERPTWKRTKGYHDDEDEDDDNYDEEDDDCDDDD